MEKVCVIFPTSESFCASWRHGCLSSPRKFIWMMPLSHFQPILQPDLRWPLTLVYDLWPHEHIKVLMQLFKWGHFHIFSLSYNLTSDDLGIWPLTAWTYEGCHILSIKQVWFQSDFNFSIETDFGPGWETWGFGLPCSLRWKLK